MKKILYVADAASIHTRRWAEYFRDQGVDVHISSFRPFAIPGVQVHHLPTYGLGRIGYFFAIPRLRQLVRKLQPEVVHAHYLTSFGFLAAIAGLHPLVVTAWGSDVLIAPKKSLLLRYFASYAVRHSDVVTTLAEHMNVSVADLGVSLDQITATPFGVDTSIFRLSTYDPQGPHLLTLICTRNHDYVYDIKTLILALAEVFSRGRRLSVDLVGDGPLRQSLMDLVYKLGLTSHVNFHGHVEHKSLARLLAGANIFVTPSLSDGNNVSLNEAMASGCFPVASDIPANAQWIKNGQNGYLYPAGDVMQLARAIEMAMDNSELRQSAKVQNRLIAETEVDWRICVKQMEDIYQRLIKSRGHKLWPMK